LCVNERDREAGRHNGKQKGIYWIRLFSLLSSLMMCEIVQTILFFPHRFPSYLH